MANKKTCDIRAAHDGKGGCNTYISLDVLVCSIAVYFYELCSILTSPYLLFLTMDGPKPG